MLGWLINLDFAATDTGANDGTIARVLALTGVFDPGVTLTATFDPGSSVSGTFDVGKTLTGKGDPTE